MKNIKKTILALSLAMGIASNQAHAIAVDTELSLLIDVSGSVDTSEYNLMMDGYANAFRDGEIQSNILSTSDGDLGKIAVNVVFFSSGAFNTVLDTFTLLDTAAAINTFADTLDSFTRPGRGGTEIYKGINASVALLTNNFEGKNLVIDVSGDGDNSVASLDQLARDSAEAVGVTINGISIGPNAIKTYYSNNIKTADGFVIHATSFETFSQGIKDKLNFETSGNDPVAVPEPATLALLGLGFLSFSVRRQRA